MDRILLLRSAAVLLILIGVLISAARLLQAQEAPAEGGVQYEEETSFDFDDDIVDGQVLRPDGLLVSGSNHDKEDSLLPIRMTFIDEIIRSVGDMPLP